MIMQFFFRGENITVPTNIMTIAIQSFYDPVTPIVDMDMHLNCAGSTISGQGTIVKVSKNKMYRYIIS